MSRCLSNTGEGTKRSIASTKPAIAARFSVPGLHLVGSRDHRLANTVSFVVERADSIALMALLDLEGICASSGSACSAGSLEPSHVIFALGVDTTLANSLVRFSLGRDSTAEEVQQVISVLPRVIRHAQGAK